MTSRERPSDAQLRSAADRIRRLSAGLESPSEESADLATFSEEAIRRSYRIVELGVGFWMDLLRLNPDRKLSSNREIIEGSDRDPGWLFGRTLGATIRSWGDLKNAQRGLLWFDSSPLLGPKIDRAVEREHLEGSSKAGKTPSGIVRLLSDSAVTAIEGILKERWPGSWNESLSPQLLWLGLQAGALEREQRNPQGRSTSLVRIRRDTVLAYCIERDLPESGKRDKVASEGAEAAIDEVKLVDATQETLDERFEKLQLAQGGRDTDWRPLYSFLRRGDVVVVTLAGELSGSGGAGWGRSWSKGRPLALAIVTSPTNWDSRGWWGRLGSVLFLDGPADPASDKRKSDQDRERLRTAFRFPSEGKPGKAEAQRGAARAAESISKLEKNTDPLAESFGFSDGSTKTTDSLGLERTVLFRSWLGQEQDSTEGQDDSDQTEQAAPKDQIDQALIEPIPVGFPGPWRRVKNHDLRATLGEFLEPHAVTVGYFEHQRAVQSGAQGPWEAWYPANLNIERFAMTSDNLRLGVAFDNPVIRSGSPSTQRIAPDPIVDLEVRKRLRKVAAEHSVSEGETRRVQAANAHRLTFDHYKRGMKQGVIEKPPEGASIDEQRRAAAFMPAITLDPKAKSRPDEALPSAGVTHRLWPKENRESDDPDPRTLLAEEIAKLLGQAKEERQVTVAAFPDSERTDLYRALDSRAFAKQRLSSTRAKIPIDPAGTRFRDACLISKGEGQGRLLIILTDDSVAAVDVGAIAWLLVAYGPKLEKGHVLDEDAYVRFRQRDPKTRDEEERRSRQKATKRTEKAWVVFEACKLPRPSKK